MGKLLNCPFCGSKPAVTTNGWAASIDCVNDACSAQVTVASEKYDDAARIWNDRRGHAQCTPVPDDASADAVREQIARIINPQLYERWDRKRETDPQADKWFEAMHPDQLAKARATADAILGLAALRAPEAADAGAVAWRIPKAGTSNGFNYVDSIEGEEDRFKHLWQPLFAFPAADAGMQDRAALIEQCAGIAEAADRPGSQWLALCQTMAPSEAMRRIIAQDIRALSPDAGTADVPSTERGGAA